VQNIVRVELSNRSFDSSNLRNRKLFRRSRTDGSSGCKRQHTPPLIRRLTAGLVTVVIANPRETGILRELCEPCGEQFEMLTLDQQYSKHLAAPRVLFDDPTLERLLPRAFEGAIIPVTPILEQLDCSTRRPG
jgi:hypothetical protein